jgi:4,5-DOPA dioxygenase extradiol
MSIPALFVSHGGPDILLKDTPASRYLRSAAADLPRPKAIVSVSAHFETSIPAVVTDAAPGMIYDFGGFPDELYSMVYPAPGAPDLAMKVGELLSVAGFQVGAARNRGYDHGTWIPLKMMYPDADIPVLQFAVQPHQGPAHHLALGRALKPLRDEGILIFASGSFTHNLREAFGIMRRGQPKPETLPAWTGDFMSWMTEKVMAKDIDALVDYRRQAPYAERNHPTDEHLLPLYVALGAAEDQPVTHAHSSVDLGVLAMDAFRFG